MSVCIYWKGRGFGDALRSVLLTQILIDNGIQAVFSEHKTCRGLCNIPIYNPQDESHKKYRRLCPTIKWVYEEDRPYYEESMITQKVRYLERRLKKRLTISRQNHNHIPVNWMRFYDIPSIDIAMCTTSGWWGPYRNWPYFKELKRKLTSNGIIYKDLSRGDRYRPKDRYYSYECLEYVRKCKLYLGLDTGMSYYVSKFANNKALILQSGFTSFEWWADHFLYDHLEIDVPCKNCFIDRNMINSGKAECKYNHQCMKEITVDWVFDEILKRLN